MDGGGRAHAGAVVEESLVTRIYTLTYGSDSCGIDSCPKEKMRIMYAHHLCARYTNAISPPTQGTQKTHQPQHQ